MTSFTLSSSIALVSIVINYVCLFYIPSAHLVKDPLPTLSTALPLLLVSHVGLLSTSLLLKQNFQPTILLKAIVSTILVTGILHILIVLFGAALIDKWYNTLLLASFLAITTVMPAFESSTTTDWIKIYLHHSPTTTSDIYAYTQVLGALIGSWLGAIVLPLDWERDWQEWPISCVISTFLGHLVGVIAGFTWASIKLISSNKKKTQ
ncbi:GPI biosynthesis protein Pig-F [Chlamydoabsidia padenii]|nr:GPI biosynthesis protein Pig-F [Chlamydoabsidia padenii]